MTSTGFGPIVLENLKLQLDEFDFLRCIYPNNGEVLLENELDIQLIQSYLNHRDTRPDPPSAFSYRVQLSTSEGVFNLHCSLSKEYPSIQMPELRVRSDMLNRTACSQMNAEMSDFIQLAWSNQCCIYQVVLWIKENAHRFSTGHLLDVPPQPVVASLTTATFARFWVYSHHIYSPRKIEKISLDANKLSLTGFCRPGKPGLFCVEGEQGSVDTFWAGIRRLQWQKIVIRRREVQDVLLGKLDTFRLFNHFYHLDGMSAPNLKQFLEQHSCGELFRELFGLPSASSHDK